MLCPVSASQSAAALLHHLGALNRPHQPQPPQQILNRWFWVKFKPLVTNITRVRRSRVFSENELSGGGRRREFVISKLPPPLTCPHHRRAVRVFDLQRVPRWAQIGSTIPACMRHSSLERRALRLSSGSGLKHRVRRLPPMVKRVERRLLRSGPRLPTASPSVVNDLARSLAAEAAMAGYLTVQSLAPAGEKSHRVTLAPDDEPVAIVLDLAHV